MQQGFVVGIRLQVLSFTACSQAAFELQYLCAHNVWMRVVAPGCCSCCRSSLELVQHQGEHCLLLRLAYWRVMTAQPLARLALVLAG